MPGSVGFIFYFLFYAAHAFLLPYLVLFYQGLGFSGPQIGTLVAVGPLISLVGAPFWTGLADATRRHKAVMSLATVMTAGAVLLIPVLGKPLPIFLLVIGLSFFSAPIGSLADSAAMHMLGGKKERYGWLRLGGTLGWGLVAPLAGAVVGAYGLRWIFVCYSSLLLISLAASLSFRYPAGSDKDTRSVRSGQRQLLADRRWWLFLVTAMICGMGFSSINTYLFPYMKELGAPTTQMSLALVLSTASEVPVMLFGHRLIRWLGARRMLLFGMGATALRLLLYSALPTPGGVLAFQVLNGLTYAVVWIAGVSYADQIAPAGLKASGQGLFGAMVFGVGASSGSFLGGVLIAAYGGQFLYLFFGLLLAASLGLVVWLGNREHVGNA